MTQSEHEGPSRRSNLPARRPRRVYRPWLNLRFRFTRERFSEFLKSMAWVVPLTVVIWIYAEREQIETRTAIAVPVRVKSTTANWSVLVASTPTVDLTLRGPLEGLEKVQSALTSQIPPGVLIELGGNLHAADNQPINVANHIQDQPLFRNNGVSVESAPPVVAVDVDQMIDLPADVQLPPDLPNVEPAATSFEPRQVHVFGPEKLLREMGDHPTVYADVSRLVSGLKPGPQKLENVPVFVPASTAGADRITVLPPGNKVTVQLVVLAADETRTIPSVPILVLAPPSLTQKYDVHVDSDSVPNVQVSGPPDKLNQLDADPPLAVLKVSLRDAGADGVKGITYLLPDGVHVAPASANITVHYTVTPRGG